jgi:Arc/MetJ-type ribon-helix-helix transcriptional regulator
MRSLCAEGGSMAMGKDTIKLSLEVSTELNNVLEQMVDKHVGTNKSEVLRKAIALMQVAVEAREKGQKIGIPAKGQLLATEFVGI